MDVQEVTMRFLPEDSIWVLLYGAERRAIFKRFEGSKKAKIQTEAGTVRTVLMEHIRPRTEK